MESIQNNEDLLHKWDIILVEIFKKEWVLISEFGCVSVLYLLHWYWFVLLVRLGYRALLT